MRQKVHLGNPDPKPQKVKTCTFDQENIKKAPKSDKKCTFGQENI